MGAAAYNRGSVLVSRQLDADSPSSELTLLRDLTDYSARHDGAVPFMATVVRFLPGGGVALMNRKVGGWRQRGCEYASIWTLARHWRLVFVGFGVDDCSRYVDVVPAVGAGQ